MNTMTRSTEVYARLVERGCLCGTERPQDCKVHGYGDNRGIAAFFKAGMPGGFPMVANCATCRSEGLMYPNVHLDNSKGSAEHRPTLVCPRCSTPTQERALRQEVEASGLHRLNERSVFATLEVAA